MYVVTLRHSCALTVVDLSGIGNKCENAELGGSMGSEGGNKAASAKSAVRSAVAEWGVGKGGR